MRRGRLLYGIVVAVCAGGMLLSGGLFVRQWLEYRGAEKAYQTLAEAAVLPPDGGGEEPEQTSDPPVPQVDFEALKRINPELTGWLYCPDTVISYPVVQGEDNRYYLTHLFDGTANAAGCLFLDSGCDGLTGKNSVIHGHHMKNGTMFASLEEYREQAYYDAHPRLYLLTPEGSWIIELFSAYVADAESDAWRLDFSSEEDYSRWLEGLQARSCFESAVKAQPADRVVTLSTCDYSYQDAWFVCHGLARPY